MSTSPPIFIDGFGFGSYKWAHTGSVPSINKSGPIKSLCIINASLIPRVVIMSRKAMKSKRLSTFPSHHLFHQKSTHPFSTTCRPLSCFNKYYPLSSLNHYLCWFEFLQSINIQIFYLFWLKSILISSLKFFLTKNRSKPLFIKLISIYN